MAGFYLIVYWVIFVFALLFFVFIVPGIVLAIVLPKVCRKKKKE